MFSTLYPILTSTEPADQAFLDVVSRIDVPKTLNRLTKAARTGEAFKVVLFQYYYTRKGEVPNLVTRIMPSGMLLQDAFFRYDLVNRLQSLFNPAGQYGDRVVVYRRRRTFFEGGVPRRSAHEFQVVLSVAAGVFQPLPAESTSSVPEPILEQLVSELPPAPLESILPPTDALFPAVWATLSDGGITATHTVDLSGNPAITVSGVPEGYFVFAEVPDNHSAIDGNGTVLKKVNAFYIDNAYLSFNPDFYGLRTMTFSTRDVEHLLIGASCSIAESDLRIQYRVRVQPTVETTSVVAVESAAVSNGGFVPESQAPESSLTPSAPAEPINVVDVDVSIWSPDQAQDGRAFIYSSIGTEKKIARVRTCSPNNPTRNSVPLVDTVDGATWMFENVGEEPLVLLQGTREVMVLRTGETGIICYADGRWE
jgi:hypothetical protein